jgi:hypothetical protein
MTVLPENACITWITTACRKLLPLSVMTHRKHAPLFPLPIMRPLEQVRPAPSALPFQLDRSDNLVDLPIEPGVLFHAIFQTRQDVSGFVHAIVRHQPPR